MKTFIIIFLTIILSSCSSIKPDRFAVEPTTTPHGEIGNVNIKFSWDL